MPDKETLRRANADRRAGKSASTQAGEFVREEIDHIREGKHGVKNAKQAIAIGLSKARRAGVAIPAKPKSTSSRRKASSRRSAAPLHAGKVDPERSRAATRALKKKPRAGASRLALSRQAHAAARKRTKADRSSAARKAARTRTRAS
jgi:hypothetical protein